MPSLAAKTDTLCIARQPILSSAGEVFGYELIYRAEADSALMGPDDPAAAQGLTDALLSVGLERLTEGRPAFLNLTRGLLLSEASLLLSPKSAVLEIQGDLAADADVVRACRDLHARGYVLAVDAFSARSAAEALLPYVRFVKVDVLTTPARQRATVARALVPRGLRLIAEHVGTRQVVQDTETAGFELFQGFFFSEPLSLEAKKLPGNQVAILNLLATLNRPNLGMGELEDLVKRDVALTLRVLQCVNSAAFGVRREISSLREALVLLGTGTIARWATVWAMAGINQGSPEVVTMAVLRGRCCELMGDRLSHGTGADLFLLGLCSLLETMLGVPMVKALEELPLAAEIRMALLGSPGAERSVLDAVIAHERGDWETSERLMDLIGLPPGLTAKAYADALRWAATLASTTR